MHARERIIEAFADLQGSGFFAMPDWQCCQSCGWAAAPDNANAVYFHEQDAEAFDEDGCIKDGDRVHLAWRGDGAMIVAALERAGCVVDWDGEQRTRIAVTTCHPHQDGVTDRDEEWFAGMHDDDEVAHMEATEGDDPGHHESYPGERDPEPCEDDQHNWEMAGAYGSMKMTCRACGIER